MRTLLLVGLLLAAPLAGCIGGDDESSGERVDLKSRANVDENTGGIQGVVTDPAIQPIEGATVKIAQTGDSTSTASDGSFAFSNVLPGDYSIEIEGEGYVGSTSDVSVTSGKVAVVDVILAHMPETQAFSQQLEFTGFVECSASTPVVAAAVCSVPNIFVANATNDRFMFTWEAEPGLHQLVAEIAWEASQPTGTTLSFNVEPLGIPNEGQTYYADETGQGPLVLSVDRERIEAVEANMTAICSGEKDPQGALAPTEPDAYCRPNFLEEGGGMQGRIFVSNADPAPVGANFQQEYHVIVTMFYNAPACESFSVFEGNECPQEEAVAER